MKNAEHPVWRIRSLLCGLLGLLFGTLSVQAERVYYQLQSVFTAQGHLMTGVFSWTYTPGDFENGTGQFLAINVPATSHGLADLNITIDVTTDIETSLNGSFHDDGVDVTLVLAEPLTPTTGAALVLGPGESKYEIGGNGFYAGEFIAGSIQPLPLTLDIAQTSTNQVELAWFPSDLDLVLLQADSAGATNWVDTVGGSNSPVAVITSEERMYFRLGYR